MSLTFTKKYKVACQIGEGSFSEVLKCQERETGIMYAAKRLKRMFYALEEVTASPEIIAMRKLSHHPNILHVLEFHVDPLPGKVTYIFELMDMSLYEMMKNRRRPMPEVRVKKYLYQLLKGLDHLHHHGIFHRDIKPENILIKNEVIKLADLGSIRGAFSKPPYTEYISTRWYRSPECLLTIGYYGPKMDVWACGCVFYELLTTKPLFPGTNEVDQINRIHNVLGTPHARLLAKFHRHKSRNCEYFFQSRTGTGLSNMVNTLTENGREILKLMLVYDPEHRSNVRRLLEHRYFSELRDQDMNVIKRITSANSNEWRNPVLLSYITSSAEKKKLRPPKRSKSGRTVGTSVQSLSSKSNVISLVHPAPVTYKAIGPKFSGPIPCKTMENIVSTKVEQKPFLSDEQLVLKRSYEGGIRKMEERKPRPKAEDIAKRTSRLPSVTNQKAAATITVLPTYGNQQAKDDINFGSITLPNLILKKSHAQDVRRISLINKPPPRQSPRFKQTRTKAHSNSKSPKTIQSKPSVKTKL